MEPKIIIWDIDGVLLAVAESYREAIIETTQHYFANLMGIPVAGRLMGWEDTQRFKLAGGFNDDWELTYAAVLCFLCSFAKEADLSGVDFSKRPQGLEEMASTLQYVGSKQSKPSLSVDLSAVTEKAKAEGGGLSGVEKAASSMFGGGVVEKAKALWFPEIIKRVFEEIYLGSELFQKKYKEELRFFRGDGLIRKEKTLASLETLLELRKKYYMGVVTGRDRFDAEFSLKKHGIMRIISSELIVCSEDTKEHKPSPVPLLECRRRICKKFALHENTESIYIGDSVDDWAAARAAGFYFVALVGGMVGQEEMQKLRLEFHDRICDLIVDEPEELLLYL